MGECVWVCKYGQGGRLHHTSGESGNEREEGKIFVYQPSEPHRQEHKDLHHSTTIAHGTTQPGQKRMRCGWLVIVLHLSTSSPRFWFFEILIFDSFVLTTTDSDSFSFFATDVKKRWMTSSASHPTSRMPCHTLDTLTGHTDWIQVSEPTGCTDWMC